MAMDLYQRYIQCKKRWKQRGGGHAVPPVPVHHVHTAARQGDLVAIRAGIAAGVDPMQTDSTGATPLDLAIEGGHIPVVVYLLAIQAVDSQAMDWAGNTPLHRAARSGDVEIVDLLIKAGFASQIHAANLSGTTPCGAALEAAKLVVARRLIQAGASLQGLDKYGQHAMHRAAWDNKCAVMAFLVESGVSVDIPNGKGATALHQAVYRGQLKAVRWLLQAGADVHAWDQQGRYPIQYAIHMDSGADRAAIIQCLLHAGAAPLIPALPADGYIPIQAIRACQNFFAYFRTASRDLQKRIAFPEVPWQPVLNLKQYAYTLYQAWIAGVHPLMCWIELDGARGVYGQMHGMADPEDALLPILRAVYYPPIRAWIQEIWTPRWVSMGLPTQTRKHQQKVITTTINALIAHGLAIGPDHRVVISQTTPVFPNHIQVLQSVQSIYFGYLHALSDAKRAQYLLLQPIQGIQHTRYLALLQEQPEYIAALPTLFRQLGCYTAHGALREEGWHWIQKVVSLCNGLVMDHVIHRYRKRTHIALLTLWIQTVWNLNTGIQHGHMPVYSVMGDFEVICNHDLAYATFCLPATGTSLDAYLLMDYPIPEGASIPDQGDCDARPSLKTLRHFFLYNQPDPMSQQAMQAKLQIRDRLFGRI